MLHFLTGPIGNHSLIRRIIKQPCANSVKVTQLAWQLYSYPEEQSATFAWTMMTQSSLYLVHERGGQRFAKAHSGVLGVLLFR